MDAKYRYGKPRACVICRRVFTPRDKHLSPKCCSNKCRGKLQTIRALRTCAVCGVEFLPKRPGYKTCGRKCGTTWRLSRHVQDPMTPVRRKLAAHCCSIVARTLRGHGKASTVERLLGYGTRALFRHLEAHFEEGMTWENYGKKKGQWSIDHTRPISSFPPEASVKEINALSNLRPMWHSRNCSKGAKWEGQ